MLLKVLNYKYTYLILTVILYFILFFIRYKQGGWDVKLDLFSQSRQILDQKIEQLLPSPQAELLSGILLGNKKDLPGGLKLALRDTSTLHIIVVSGQNLTMVAGFFMNLSGLIKRKIAIGVSILFVIFYTLLTGAQVPVLRAAAMAILAFTAQLFGRQRDGVWVLIATAGLMLLVNPNWISDLSFQLSFLATAGVIIVAPILLKYLKSMPLVGEDLAITTGAQIMVMPVIIQYFHQLSLVGIVTNLLVGWSVPVIMIFGVGMMLMSLIWVGLAQVAALVTSIFLTYFIYIVQFFSSLPFAWKYVGEQIWVVWVGYYIVLGGVLLLISKLKVQS